MMSENNTAVTATRQLIGLVKHLVTMLGQILDLVLLETKLASKSLLVLCGLMSFSLILLSATWLSLLTALAFYLIYLGLLVPWVFLSLVAIHLILILGIIFLIRHYGQNLNFNASKRQLRLEED